MTLTYEQLLERSEGRYEIEPYRDLCRHEVDRKYADENASRHRHYHGNHHYRHNKIDQFKVDVVVKETSNVKKLVTHPKDTSPMKVQSIIAGLSDMIPRSVSVGDDSGGLDDSMLFSGMLKLAFRQHQQIYRYPSFDIFSIKPSLYNN